MLKAWRIVKTRYAASAFDGEGARRFGGRWSSKGVRVVYAAGPVALAVLAALVRYGTHRCRGIPECSVECINACVPLAIKCTRSRTLRRLAALTSAVRRPNCTGVTASISPHDCLRLFTACVTSVTPLSS